MKKLLVSILCIQLILSPLAVAEDATTTPAQEGSAIPYINMALGLGSGIIGTQIVATCKLSMTQPSLIIYLSGSLAYIAKEILSAKSQSQFTDFEIQSIDVQDAQMNLLEKQKASEEQNLSVIRSKRNWMIAITTIYTAAMASAILEALAVPLGKTDAAGCTAPNTALSDGVLKAIKLAYLSGAVFQTGKGIVNAAQSGNAVGIGGSLIGANSVASAVVSVATNGEKKLDNFFKVVKTSKDVQENITTKMLNNAVLRAVVFGATAATSGIIMGDLIGQENKTQDNINKMNAVIANLKKDSLGNSAINTDKKSNLEDTDPSGNKKNYKLTDLPSDSGEVKSCWNSNASDFSPESCSGPMKFSRPVFDIKFNAPTIQNAANMAHDLALAVSAGDMAKAEVSVNNLAGMASRLKEIKDNLSSELNKKLVASGKKAIDFDKAIQDHIFEVKKQMSQSSDIELASQSPASVATSAANKDSSNVLTKSSSEDSLFPDVSEFNQADLSGEEVSASQKTTSLYENLNQYESSVQDISNKSDVSIFKQLSNRYLLNYGRIFEKKNLGTGASQK